MTNTLRETCHPDFADIDGLLQHWLDERQALLVTFNKLCVMRPNSHTSYTEEVLREFCSQVIEYASTTHFDILPQIDKALKNCGLPTIEKRFINNIKQCTNAAISFIDRYSSTKVYDKLSEDISTLGMKLASRFDWEDSLIELYLDATDIETARALH